MRTHAYQKPWISHEGPAGRCETQLWPLNVLFWLSIPPPHNFTYLRCGERFISSNAEQFLSIQRLCHSVLWHTGSPHCIIIIIISNIISLLHLTLKKSKLTLLGCHYARFWLGPLAFYSCFQLSFECLWPALMRSSLPPGHHENHLVWVDSSLS